MLLFSGSVAPARTPGAGTWIRTFPSTLCEGLPGTGGEFGDVTVKQVPETEAFGPGWKLVPLIVRITRPPCPRTFGVTDVTVGVAAVWTWWGPLSARGMADVEPATHSTRAPEAASNSTARITRR